MKITPPQGTPALGPLMIGVAGHELTAEERMRLRHPLVGGVILFTRNYRSPEQLKALTAGIAAVREERLLVAVDHEGGRVQRFREGFTRIPAMRAFGDLWDVNPDAALSLAEDAGFVIGTELAHHGIDFPFAPVLDIDHGNSSVIGDRSFHHSAAGVVELASALQAGMQRAGMISVGKHFPGHGFAHADSHVETPVDERAFTDLESHDLAPFQQLISAGLGAVMPAHVIYPAVDSRAAGFSSVWLKDILREKMRFAGAVISDDLGMAGARVAGTIVERANAALGAGCDLILSCNDPVASATLLDGLGGDFSASAARLAKLRRTGSGDVESPDYLMASQRVATFADQVRAAKAAANDIVASL
jgi:beta-N-acetylhexosaminidase